MLFETAVVFLIVMLMFVGYHHQCYLRCISTTFVFWLFSRVFLSEFVKLPLTFYIYTDLCYIVDSIFTIYICVFFNIYIYIFVLFCFYLWEEEITCSGGKQVEE